MVVAAVLTVAAFANSIGGEFVYDDDSEIVENPYIQQGRYFWKAMASDVWAFKGEREEAWSNYWRPVFVAWMAMNYQLFGLDTTGWHITSILLHLVVTLLVYRVSLRLGFPPAVCAAATWIFAVHPAHVESVSWASGIPEVLVATFLLTAYLCYLTFRTGGKRFLWVVALVAYALGLMSKEAAVVFPLAVFGSEWILSGSPSGGPRGAAGRFIRSVKLAVPFACVGLVYMVARYAILGKMASTPPQSVGLVGVIASAPAVLCFYLRQAFLPIQLSLSYPLRPVTNANIGAINFVIPLVATAVILAVASALHRRNSRYGLSMLWFGVPLSLAFYIRVFLPEEIVHDRYLYLSVFGAALTAVGAAADLGRLRGRTVLVGGAVVCAALLTQTVRYNRVWHDNISLFERSVQVDPDSALAHGQLGNLYRRAGRTEDAIRVLQRALEIHPDMRIGVLNLAIIAVDEGRYDEAEGKFKRVLDVYPDDAVAIDQLVRVYAEQKRFSDATALLQTAIERVPYERIKYTRNLAVLAFHSGDKSAAVRALESIRDDLLTDANADTVTALYMLGDLYRELGRPDDAVEAFRQFLEVAKSFRTAELDRMRESVRRRIGR